VFIDYFHSLQVIADWPVWTRPPSAQAAPCFRIQDVPGKGKGVIAVRNIARGEIIHAERPVYVARRTLACAEDQTNANGVFYRAALNGLSSYARSAILALSNSYPPHFDIVPGVLNSNRLDIQISDAPDNSMPSQFVGCFPILSRVNHDCAPSANYIFDFMSFEGQLRALRDIAAGEEITITYTRLCTSRSERQAALSGTRFFTCLCPTCSLPPPLRAQSDVRRAQLADLIATLEDVEFPPRLPFEQLEQALANARDEGLVVEYGQVLLLGSQVLTIYYELHVAVEWAEKARSLFLMIEGSGSQKVRKLEEASRVHSLLANAPRTLQIK